VNRTNKNLIAFQIQNEYKMINDKWLKMHYQTLISIVILSFFFERITATSYYMGDFVEIAFTKYVYKYMLVPFIANIILVGIAFFVMRFSAFEQRTKVYFISSLSVGFCFVFYTVHSIFDTLYLIFFIPILLTVVYSDFILTSMIAVISIGARAISEFFIVWDPEKTNPLDTSLSFWDFIVSTFVLLLLYLISIVVIRFEKEKNAVIVQKEIGYRETQKKLIVDELTNIYNRTALRISFQEIVDDEFDSKYVFVLIDLDDFKLLNDTFGHQYGDYCLVQFGDILKKNCPKEATPFRYGGDEFCILFKNVEIDTIVKICKHIQRELKMNLADKSADKHVTASIGIAEHKKGMSPSQLFRKTDLALYRSKGIGNSIYVFNENEDFEHS
jgi:diguanylate cyclase